MRRGRYAASSMLELLASSLLDEEMHDEQPETNGAEAAPWRGAAPWPLPQTPQAAEWWAAKELAERVRQRTVGLEDCANVQVAVETVLTRGQPWARGGKYDGAIDAKTKELIALAIGITARCDGCLAYHARAAARLGASREEILEVIGVAVYMGGGPSMIYGSEALAAYDGLSGSDA